VCEALSHVREGLLELTGERLGSEPTTTGMRLVLMRLPQRSTAWMVDGSGCNLAKRADSAKAVSSRERSHTARRNSATASLSYSPTNNVHAP